MIRRAARLLEFSTALAERPQAQRQVSLCHGCEHLEGANEDGTARCAAFASIPVTIWAGRADHRQPIQGDGGVTFSPLGGYGAAIASAFDAQVVTAAGAAPDGDPDEEDPEDDGEGQDPPPPAAGPEDLPESGSEPTGTPDEEEHLEDAPAEQWHALLTVEGVRTGDRRLIENGALTWRSLPQSILWQTETPEQGGHAHAVEVAQVTRIERHGPEIHAWGHYLNNVPADGRIFSDYLAEVGRAGISVDMDDAEVEVDFPEPEDEDDEVGFLFAEPELVRFTKARIMGATVVTFPAFAEAYIEPVSEPSEADVLVAAAIPAAPPADWFQNPNLTGPTPLTITDDGRVFGHLATWGTCHTGFQGTCVTPPYEDEMPYFTTGEVRCADGSSAAVGQITLGTGHADGTLTPELATAHYDHTGTGAADVAAGPDAYGIWLAGALRPGTSPEDIRALRAASVSGDWRRIGGQLRLLGVLAVNVPGFPIPRTSAYVSGGEQRTLVAAGVLRRHDRQRRDPRRAIADHLAARIGRTPEALVASLVARVHPEHAGVGAFAAKPCSPCAAKRRAAQERAARSSAAKAAGGTAPIPKSSASYEVLTASGESSKHATLIEALTAKRQAGRGARMRVVTG